jgi:hypothetical protein
MLVPFESARGEGEGVGELEPEVGSEGGRLSGSTMLSVAFDPPSRSCCPSLSERTTGTAVKPFCPT